LLWLLIPPAAAWATGGSCAPLVPPGREDRRASGSLELTLLPGREDRGAPPGREERGEEELTVNGSGTGVVRGETRLLLVAVTDAMLNVVAGAAEDTKLLGPAVEVTKDKGDAAKVLEGAAKLLGVEVVVAVVEPTKDKGASGRCWKVVDDVGVDVVLAAILLTGAILFQG
jgi:hypothetical protein